MIIDLIDWKDEKHPVDIGDLDNIEEMFIKVVTGDEILHVLYKDGTELNLYISLHHALLDQAHQLEHLIK